MLDGQRPIRVRKIDFDFHDVPRRWFWDSTFTTHVCNGLNLLFPAGERFFIRSVKHYLDDLDDPELRARCRAFFGQEGSHGLAHERAFAILKSQGYDVDEWLARYEHTAYARIAPMFSPLMHLSVTVALEHFTATMAEMALTQAFFDGMHPAMQALLRWHACEEIEHKSVAFDVLARVDSRYRVRVAGLVLATAGLMLFWWRASRMLIAQDLAAGRTSKATLAAERKQARGRGQNQRFILRAIAQYLRPGFHPDQHDNYALARGYLSAIGRLDG